MTARARVLAAIALTAFLAAFCIGSATAQDEPKKKGDAPTRSIQGKVVDADEKPIVGAVVQLKDLRTMQVRSYLSKEAGEFHFSTLKTDNDYEVEAKADGKTSGWKKVSVFDTRKVVVLNLKVEKADKP